MRLATNEELLDALMDTFTDDSKAYLYFEARAAVHERMTARQPVTAKDLWQAWIKSRSPAYQDGCFLHMEGMAVALAARTGSAIVTMDSGIEVIE